MTLDLLSRLERRWQRNALAEMPEHLLRDIGIEVDELTRLRPVPAPHPSLRQGERHSRALAPQRRILAVAMLRS